jgi:hypothetical protein
MDLPVSMTYGSTYLLTLLRIYEHFYVSVPVLTIIAIPHLPFPLATKDVFSDERGHRKEINCFIFVIESHLANPDPDSSYEP